MVLVPELATLTGLLVALGLLVVATALTVALFTFAEKSVGWIPFVGGWSAKKVRDIGQAVNNYMTNAASGLGVAVGATWHAIAQSLRFSLDLFLGLAEWAYRLEWYILKKHPVAIIDAYVAKLLRRVWAQNKQIIRVYERVHDAAEPLTHPEAGPIAAGVRIGLRPIRAQVAALQRWTISRVQALQHAIAVDLPREIKGAREIAKEAERVAERLWAQVKRLDKVTTGVFAAALVASALARLGGSWIICRNWRKIGRSVCRFDPLALDMLLGASVAAMVLSDVCFATRAGIAAAKAAAPAILGIAAVTDAALNCTSFPPAPALPLHTTALPTPDSPLPI